MTFLSKINSKINAYRGIPPAVEKLYQSVKKYLPKNPTIIEAGAHMGYDTLGLSKIWAKGFIYGFEPVPNLYLALKERLRSQSNVKTYNLALGESSTSIPMHVSSGRSNASSSILKPSKHIELFPDVVFNDTISVEMVTLKEWAIQENISTIDMMWLDMQGYEVSALQGSGDLLQNVSVIYTELCKNELYTGMITQYDFIKFLNGLGFELISFDGDEEISEGIFINIKAIAKQKQTKL